MQTIPASTTISQLLEKIRSTQGFIPECLGIMKALPDDCSDDHAFQVYGDENSVSVAGCHVDLLPSADWAFRIVTRFHFDAEEVFASMEVNHYRDSGAVFESMEEQISANMDDMVGDFFEAVQAQRQAFRDALSSFTMVNPSASIADLVQTLRIAADIYTDADGTEVGFMEMAKHRYPITCGHAVILQQDAPGSSITDPEPDANLLYVIPLCENAPLKILQSLPVVCDEHVTPRFDEDGVFSLSAEKLNVLSDYFGIKTSLVFSPERVSATVSCVHFEDGLGVNSQSMAILSGMNHKVTGQPHDGFIDFFEKVKDAQENVVKSLSIPAGLTF